VRLGFKDKCKVIHLVLDNGSAQSETDSDYWNRRSEQSENYRICLESFYNPLVYRPPVNDEERERLDEWLEDHGFKKRIH
jgi:hypothetical protein